MRQYDYSALIQPPAARPAPSAALPPEETQAEKPAPASSPPPFLMREPSDLYRFDVV
jgi:hypothetical protein